MSLTCSSPSMPPRSTNAPKSARRRTTPLRTCPSASWKRNCRRSSSRSRSRTRRRLSTPFLPRRSISVTSHSSQWPMNDAKSSWRTRSTWLIGMKPRSPCTRNSSPPMLLPVTRPFTTSPTRNDARSACVLASRSESRISPDSRSKPCGTRLNTCPTCGGSSGSNSSSGRTPSALLPMSTNTSGPLMLSTRPGMRPFSSALGVCGCAAAICRSRSWAESPATWSAISRFN